MWNCCCCVSQSLIRLIQTVNSLFLLPFDSSLLLVYGGVRILLPECHAVLQLLSQSDCRPAEKNSQQKPVSCFTLPLFPQRRWHASMGRHSHYTDSAEYGCHPQTFPGNQLFSTELVLVTNWAVGEGLDEHSHALLTDL